VLYGHGCALRGLKECRRCHEKPELQESLQHWCRLASRKAPKRKEVLQELDSWKRPRKVEISEEEELRCVKCPQQTEKGVVMGSLRKIPGDDGKPMSKLEACMVPECIKEHRSRLLNRDVNATKNLMQVLEAMVAGRERPEHLRRPG
jgi:hypothetical protein